MDYFIFYSKLEKITKKKKFVGLPKKTLNIYSPEKRKETKY